MYVYLPNPYCPCLKSFYVIYIVCDVTKPTHENPSPYSVCHSLDPPLHADVSAPCCLLKELQYKTASQKRDRLKGTVTKLRQNYIWSKLN